MILLKKCCHVFFAIIIVAIMVIISAFPAFAYSYSGIHFASNSVYYNSSSLSASWRTAVNNAANTWNNAPADFTFNYYSLGTFTISSYDAGDSGWYGRTYTSHDGSYHIYDVVTYFNTYYSYDVETVALHEFGHWLQLNDQIYDPSVMHYTYTGVKRSLNADDVAGIVRIYGEE